MNFKRHSIQACLLGLLLLTGLLMPREVKAQTVAYWEFEAQGEVNLVHVADINLDRLDDVLIVSNGSDLSLLNGSGELVWRIPLEEANLGRTEPILEIVTLIRPLLDGNVGDSEVVIIASSLSRTYWIDQNGSLLLTTSNVAEPLKTIPFDHDGDGYHHLLVATRTGNLLLIDGGSGDRIWAYRRGGDEAPNPRNAQPHLALLDTNQDGLEEIIFAFEANRQFGELELLNGAGELVWRHALPGRITGVSSIEDLQGESLITVGTSRGNLVAYDGEGVRLWQRTLNRAITDLEPFVLAGTPAIGISTEVGRLVAFNPQGQRIIDLILGESPEDGIVSLSHAQQGGRGWISALIDPTRSALVSGPPRTVILDEDGRVSAELSPVEINNPPRLIDINRDGVLELLVPTFSTVSLQALGEIEATTTKYFATDWAFRLNDRPLFLFEERQLDGDGVWIGSESGQFFGLSPLDGSIRWEQTFPRDIDLFSSAQRPDGLHMGIAYAVRGDVLNELEIGQENVEINPDLPLPENQLFGLIDVYGPQGETIWASPVRLESEIVSLRLSNNQNSDALAVYYGTNDGFLGEINGDGETVWETFLNRKVTDINLLPTFSGGVSLIATLDDEVLTRHDDAGLLQAISPPVEERIRSVDVVGAEEFFPASADGVSVPRQPVLLVTTGSLQLIAYDDGLQRLPDWTYQLAGPPARITAHSQIVYIAFPSGEVRALRMGGEQGAGFFSEWVVTVDQFPSQAEVDDLNDQIVNIILLENRQNSASNELMISLSSGRSIFVSARDGSFIRELNLLSPVFQGLSLETSTRGNPLLALTENGVLRNLSLQDNHAPLLTEPQTSATLNQYSFSVNVIDIENDPVIVGLYLFDPVMGDWTLIGERRAQTGRERLSWVIDPLSGSEPVAYQLRYDDGVNLGLLEPEAGVRPLQEENQFQIVLPLVGVGLLLLLLYFIWRISLSNYWATRQYLRQITYQPERSLFEVADVYRRTTGSPDVLLSLTGQVRKTDWRFLADICDGLYLLNDRPQAGLEILSQALKQDEFAIDGKTIHLEGLDAWHTFYQSARILFGVPSVVELSLQMPRLEKAVHLLNETNIELESLAQLVEPLDRLSESGRISTLRDRIAYLQEANFLLLQEEKSYAWRPYSIPNRVAVILNQRWRGLINANISELLGRPWFNPILKTRHLLVSDRETEVALELVNEGQAAARQVIVELAESPQYGMVNAVRKIPYLQTNHPVMVNFPITPHAREDIRLTFSITYFDALNKFHHFEFADMATFLEGVANYQKINNPYAPGTPLRRGSPLFYGRRALLDFIISNALQVFQQNVVVLVGQRRTGKTSILLHLSDLAPEHLLPVYVDCQSLGVMPGMVGFLHDIAWFIADACYLRDIEIEVPDIENWERDPAHAFQREFLPYVYEKLPKSGKILLIFDEFEAFEDLVEAGMLPPTFFAYLRHLMQHAERLSFVFAGTHRLEMMGSDYWSVFFNIALYRQVTYLDDDALRNLIIKPVAPNLVYDDLALDRIQRATAGHPYFVQLVCYTLVNYANKNRTQYITISDVNICLKEMLRLGEVHFAYLWQESSVAERAVLTSMAHLLETDRPVDPAQIADSLASYNFDIEPTEILRALRRLVSRGIMQEYQEPRSSLYEMRVGLVSMWVYENKSLSKLYEI